MISPLLAMHLPDGFLSIPVGAIGWAALIIMIVLALRHTREQLNERQIPLMGVLAAFVFAAQMINFPVAGGTSGHLLGGALISILLGPWAAVLIMTSVLSVQALIFQDGGLLAIGLNAVNMGVIAAFTGHAAYTLIRRVLGDSRQSLLIGAAAASWISVVIAAAATAFELAFSNTARLEVALPAMISVHVLIGIGEALITAAALAFIQQTRPDFIRGSQQGSGSGWIAAGLLIALAITFTSPLADPNPDGLERVAEDYGFIDAAQPPPFSVLPDYTVPIIENEAVSTIAAGVIGVIIVAGVSYTVTRISRKRDADEAA